MISDIDPNAVMSSLSLWETAGYISTAAVTLGCVGEFVHEFTPWLKRCHWWNLKGGKASAILLILALAAEIPIQVKANTTSGLLIAFLSDKAEAARLETARVKAQIAWRELSQDQITKLVIALKTNSPGPITVIASSASDPEVIAYTNQIRETLSNAGFGSGIVRGGTISFAPPTGLSVMSAVPGAAARIISAFAKIEVVVHDGGVPGIQIGGPTMLFIGARPRPTQ